eukprot:scaffold363458_cov41-Prasinocladus_malaysianus.AAC.1
MPEAARRFRRGDASQAGRHVRHRIPSPQRQSGRQRPGRQPGGLGQSRNEGRAPGLRRSSAPRDGHVDGGA